MSASFTTAGPGAAIRGIGGVDEAGRGPLAGAVVAAIVVLGHDQRIQGVRDSKQLSARQRENAAARIRREALAWSLGRAEVHEIDAVNILNATFLAMQRAVQGLTLTPAEIRVDGNRAPRFPGYAGTVSTLVSGDRHCPAISAASILAKVARDEEMLVLHEAYPEYGFARHKGYPTAYHRAVLMRLGPCVAHRRSFQPVRDALGRVRSP